MRYKLTSSVPEFCLCRPRFSLLLITIFVIILGESSLFGISVTTLARISWGIQALSLGSDQNIYGVTSYGGKFQEGILFKMTPDGSITTLLTFDGTNGSSPRSAPIQSSDGNLYGTTSGGGARSFGTVFKMAPSGKLNWTVSLGDFGGFPFANLVQGINGDFYGTTTSGGAVYKVTRTGALTRIAGLSFLDGHYPIAPLLQDADGSLFGAASGGGLAGYGTVFKVSPSGVVQRILSFDGVNGSSVWAGLIDGHDGWLYGTSVTGGDSKAPGSSGFGTVFKLKRSGEIATLVHFNGTNGANPYAPLLRGADGNFYGTTSAGGESNRGTLFRVTPTGQFNTLFSFDDFPSRSGLIQDADGNIYGGAGATVFRLRLADSPSIIRQPKDQFASLGSKTTFLMIADGRPSLSYRWYLDGNPIEDATNASLTIEYAHPANSGAYSVVVTNTFGSATSGVARLILIQQTDRLPTTGALGVPSIPTDDFLMVFSDGRFANYLPLDPSAMTVVFTHGWNSNPGEWATIMASLIRSNPESATANIVAWDWSSAARSDCSPSKVARRTPRQGNALGHALLVKLGSSYSKPIHFIGHSMGTMVNAAAADFLHGNGYQWQKTHVTLFDEAEVALGEGCIELGWNMGTASGLGLIFGDPLSNSKTYYSPLPKQYVWADNYVSAFGLLQSEAANVILTRGFPANASTYTSLIEQLASYHSYPCEWYDLSIKTSRSLMGFRWSFETGGEFSQAPDLHTTFIQVASSELELLPMNFEDANELLKERTKKYSGTIHSTFVQTLGNSTTANGQLAIESLATGPSFALRTVAAEISPDIESDQSSLGGQPNEASLVNVPAYVWIPIEVASNAVAMSFDFSIVGDGVNDLFDVALDGTNVFSVELSLLETNVTRNSGSIDVLAWRSRHTELFFGISGGTSSNATVIIGDIRFYSTRPPVLNIRAVGTNVVATWPLAASDYFLEATDSLVEVNPWVTVTNTPIILNFENTITNSAHSRSSFYRLRQRQ